MIDKLCSLLCLVTEAIERLCYALPSLPALSKLEEKRGLFAVSMMSKEELIDYKSRSSSQALSCQDLIGTSNNQDLTPIYHCRYKHAVFPHSRAIAALVQAFANQDLEKAFDLYCQLRQDSMGAAAVTLSDRFMWQSLIEAACRKSRLSMALQVQYT